MDSTPSHRSDLRALLSLAWPIVLSRATQAVVGFSDALMTAPLGEQALAAVTTGALDMWCIAMLPIGTVFILQSFSSQLRGRGDLTAAGRYAYYGLLLSAVSGVLALGLLPLLGPILGTVGYEAKVAKEMEIYMSIRLLSVAAMVGSEALNNWYGGLENTRLGLVFSVVTMVANLLLNFLLIEPRFGLPGYGVAGAAWASTIASGLGFLGLLLCFALRVGHSIPRGRPKLTSHEFWRMLRFGVPNGFNYFMEFASFALFINVVVGHLGTKTLAAFNVVFQLNMMSIMPAFGVASAGAIMVGEAIGSGHPDRVPALVWLSTRLSAGWMLSVGLCYFLFPHVFMELFLEQGKLGSGMLEVGALMLGLSGIWQLFDAIGMNLAETLRAAGDTSWPMKARLLLAWLVFTPGAWLSVRVLEGGPSAAMMAIILYLAALALVLIFRFRSGAWRRISLLESSEPALLSSSEARR